MTEAGSKDKTSAAFAIFRSKHGPRTIKLTPKNLDELVQMPLCMESWVDGPGAVAIGEVPELTEKPDDVRLWVVRPDDVVHADEHCLFGQTLESGVIKHSNLTAGAPAHCGGELLFLAEDVIALTGGSGRYGPESCIEMSDVAKAFRDSGYGVWNFGYDDELKVPFRFGSRLPDWVL